MVVWLFSSFVIFGLFSIIDIYKLLCVYVKGVVLNKDLTMMMMRLGWLWTDYCVVFSSFGKNQANSVLFHFSLLSTLTLTTFCRVVKGNVSSFCCPLVTSQRIIAVGCPCESTGISFYSKVTTKDLLYHCYAVFTIAVFLWQWWWNCWWISGPILQLRQLFRSSFLF